MIALGGDLTLFAGVGLIGATGKGVNALRVISATGSLVYASYESYQAYDLLTDDNPENDLAGYGHVGMAFLQLLGATADMIPLLSKQAAAVAKAASEADNVALATKGGFALPGGSSTSGSFGRSAQVLDEVIDIAQSQRFIDRARRLGFSDDAINALPNRLRQYGNNVGETLSGGWANGDQFLVGRWGVLSTRNQRIMHELGHVLDDIANPGLFARSAQSGFGWRGFYHAESVAYFMQSGRFRPIAAGFNATSQAYPLTTRVIVVTGFTYIVYEGHDELLWLIGFGK